MGGEPCRLLHARLNPFRPRSIQGPMGRLRQGCRSARRHGRGAPFEGAGRGCGRGRLADFEDRAQARCGGAAIGHHRSSLAAASLQAFKIGGFSKRRGRNALACECAAKRSVKPPSSCPSPQGEKGRCCSLFAQGEDLSFNSLSPWGESRGEGGLSAWSRPTPMAPRPRLLPQWQNGIVDSGGVR